MEYDNLNFDLFLLLHPEDWDITISHKVAEAVIAERLIKEVQSHDKMDGNKTLDSHPCRMLPDGFGGK
jgi:hypothetical protein